MYISVASEAPFVECIMICQTWFLTASLWIPPSNGKICLIPCSTYYGSTAQCTTLVVFYSPQFQYRVLVSFFSLHDYLLSQNSHGVKAACFEGKRSLRTQVEPDQTRQIFIARISFISPASHRFRRYIRGDFRPAVKVAKLL